MEQKFTCYLVSAPYLSGDFVADTPEAAAIEFAKWYASIIANEPYAVVAVKIPRTAEKHYAVTAHVETTYTAAPCR